MDQSPTSKRHLCALRELKFPFACNVLFGLCFSLFLYYELDLLLIT